MESPEPIDRNDSPPTDQSVNLSMDGIVSPPPDELDPRLREMDLTKLFVLFLGFGLRAWGGPMAQIDMLRTHFVQNLGWISKSRFNRVLAVYQALPGPEATELACYFGMMSRGRIGAVLGGLGFLLPGFCMMLLISFLYVKFGISSPLVQKSMSAVQPCVAAMVVRAVHRISETAFHDEVSNSFSTPLLLLAIFAAVQNIMGINFFITLIYGGIIFLLIRKAQESEPQDTQSTEMQNFATTSDPVSPVLSPSPSTDLLQIPTNQRKHVLQRFKWHIAAAGVVIFGVVLVIILKATVGLGILSFGSGPSGGLIASKSLPGLFALGLLAGLLTFGGAYTAIPFVQQDAVVAGKWLASQVFLDGIAVAQILPAPLVIFSTFVGYIGGGFPGAFLMTLGMFLPAFSFTLVGHNFFEKLVKIHAIRSFLDGITGSVIGLIAVTAVQLIKETVKSAQTSIIFGMAMAALYALPSPWTSPLLVLCTAIAGQVLIDV